MAMLVAAGVSPAVDYVLSTASALSIIVFIINDVNCWHTVMSVRLEGSARHFFLIYLRAKLGFYVGGESAHEVRLWIRRCVELLVFGISESTERGQSTGPYVIPVDTQDTLAYNGVLVYKLLVAAMGGFSDDDPIDESPERAQLALLVLGACLAIGLYSAWCGDSAAAELASSDTIGQVEPARDASSAACGPLRSKSAGVNLAERSRL